MPSRLPTARRVRAACAAGSIVAALAARGAGAQLPGLPVLQSPFVAPQLAVAVNGGRTGEGGASAVGVAGAWTPASARVQLSGGAAVVTRESRSGAGAGARAYLPLRTFAGQAVALGFLVGAGGDRVGGATTLTTPVGVSVGYRRRFGETRALSLHAVPFYSYTRASGVGEGAARSSSLLRLSVGADVVVVPRVGLSLGVEAGTRAADDQPGPRRTVTGLGVSYAF